MTEAKAASCLTLPWNRSLFERNLLWLKTQDPTLGKAWQTHFDTYLQTFRREDFQAPNSVQLLCSRRGWPTLLRHGASLHSHYDPLKEAAGQLGTDSPLTIQIGLGLGYLLLAFAQHPGPGTLWAVEPEHALQAAFFGVFSLEKCPLARVRFFPDLDTLFQHLGEKYRKDTRVGIHLAPWLQKEEAMVQPLRARLRELHAQALFRERTNFNRMADVLHMTYLSWHYQRQCQWCPYDFLPPNKTPVVLASPGPSLTRNLFWLKRFRNRFQLWALSRSLELLELSGISPDVLVHLEYQDYNALIDRRIATSRVTHLVADQVHFQWTLAPAPCRFLYTNPYNDMSQWLWSFDPPLPPAIEPSGSVASDAIQLALQGQPPALILVGQDLALTNSLAYATQKTPKVVASSSHERTPGFWGQPVDSPFNYQRFRSFLADLASKHSGHGVLINATEGGSSIPGWQQLPLRVALASLPDQKRALSPRRQHTPKDRASVAEALTHPNRQRLRSSLHHALKTNHPFLEQLSQDQPLSLEELKCAHQQIIAPLKTFPWMAGFFQASLSALATVEKDDVTSLAHALRGFHQQFHQQVSRLLQTDAFLMGAFTLTNASAHKAHSIAFPMAIDSSPPMEPSRNQGCTPGQE